MIFDRQFDHTALYDFFDHNNDKFSSNLHDQISRSGNGSLKQYIEKLCTKGTIACEKDESGNILGAVIGYTHDLPENKASYITYVLVGKEYRGRGIFSRLMAEYEAHCRSNDVRSMWLTTGKKNVAAQQAYEKMGFVLRGEYSETMVKYEKIL